METERIRIESSIDTNSAMTDHTVWAEGGLDMALHKIERIRMSLIHATEMLRDNEAEASHLVVHCVDGLERFLEMTLVTRCALKLDFSRIQVDGIALSQIEQQFKSILTSLLEYREKQDYAGIADTVEDELLTNLARWTRALRQLQTSRSSNA